MKHLTDYIYESKVSTDLKEFVTQLKQYCTVKFDSYMPWESGKITVFIKKNTFDTEDENIKKLLSNSNVFIAAINDDVYDNPPDCISIIFEQKYAKNVSNTIYNQSDIILYHLTKNENVKSILDNGIEPREFYPDKSSFSKRKMYHPARVYMLNNTIETRMLKNTPAN